MENKNNLEWIKIIRKLDIVPRPLPGQNIEFIIQHPITVIQYHISSTITTVVTDMRNETIQVHIPVEDITKKFKIQYLDYDINNKVWRAIMYSPHNQIKLNYIEVR